ncbi:PREDICTED: uncharacterized protein LOC108771317 [Cyphomyrmex costatus]|uniref:uncharacterized protein LOC108771317 n=1 Tax=Cyphomyrmex costatus TaxID=456900 RepID=UPI00085230FC|nr:PREDICTED: uncharacterized protein LOC108771317 [Cyphomyrmex costatus]
MTTCFINQLNEDGLNIDKLVGIGVDGANSMIGPHNSLSSRVLALVPHLIVVQCLCHSLHLAAENACSSLPRHIDYLIETSHSWFSTSAKKTNEFADLFKTINQPEELQKRIPKNMQILEKISAFSPQNAKNETKIDDITAIVVAFERILSDIDTTLNEWSLIHRAEINADTSDEFWRAIDLIVDSAGQKRFSNISKLALALLTVPFSNASVERAFSIVNIVKDKLRNKLEVKTIDAILRVRFLMENKCDNFEPTPLMLKKFVSEVVYTGDISDEALNIMEHCDKILNSNMEEL